MAGGPRGFWASGIVEGGAVAGGKTTADAITIRRGIGKTGAAAIAKPAPDNDAQSGQIWQSAGL
jgi:hypothetical protein